MRKSWFYNPSFCLRGGYSGLTFGAPQVLFPPKTIEERFAVIFGDFWQTSMIKKSLFSFGRWGVWL